MRSASAAAERSEEVRDAARGWKRAGAIEEGTFAEILKRFPELRVRPSTVWRALTGFFVSIAILAALGMAAVGIRLNNATAWEVLFFLASVACVVAAELQDASPRLALRGGVGATSFWSVVFALSALFLLLEERHIASSEGAITIVFFAGAAAWAGATWRWGIPAYAVFAAIALFAALARWPLGRIWWIAAGGALAFASAGFVDSKRVPPSLRTAAALTCAASLVAVYGAVNVYSWDEHVLESFWSRGTFVSSGSPLIRVLSILGTVLVPVFVLAWGLRSRRTLLIDVGVLLTVFSLVTLRHYVHLAPLWVILTGSGAVLLALAVLGEKKMRRAPLGEVSGFTADPLFDDEKKRRGLELVPVVAAFGAQAPPAAPQEPGRFEGGGGSGGGGGTTDGY